MFVLLALVTHPRRRVIGKAEVVEEASGETSANSSHAPVCGAHGRRTVWFWALGDMLPLACAAARQLRAAGVVAGVVNARFIKPLDTQLLAEQAATPAIVATLENGAVAGGFGSAVQEALTEQGCANPVLRFGWPDAIIGQGTTTSLMAAHGLTPDAVAAKVLVAFGRPQGE